mmetsp:Transcript_23396/g.58066  ORF Transcript_23396/g.58066 Transcript_23396/m.58066 type:complete len:140 (-) Transcript_23396:400-819(-)|eukprot:CAMPEP_0174902158 /NCGR_PEP_ID=MMETSP0167-20121228/37029_1 /TAXON_ID=38298 /ORGANISM="Rhodella maculata, Strain CCMP736" /LENGTH=139 /DNA_ID=CAMNT_0016144075 /DNA_START=609 /DNA_END=1028 /DNA_ORIENTATION=-
MPSLTELELIGLATTTKEDLVKLLGCVKNLKVLTLSQVKNSFDLDVITALPNSIESLEIPFEPVGCDEFLRFVGALPRLKSLCLRNRKSANWLFLLPAAPRLENFTVSGLDASGKMFLSLREHDESQNPETTAHLLQVV